MSGPHFISCPLGSNSSSLSIFEETGFGLLFSEMFPKLTGPSWSLEGGRGGPGDGHVPPAQPPVASERPAGGARAQAPPRGQACTVGLLCLH